MGLLDFSDTSVEKAGLIQTCEVNCFGDNGYTHISGNASLLAQFTNYLNEAYSRYAGIAMSSDGTFQVDDTNYTTIPVATANLVDGTQGYNLATSHIQLLSVEAKDEGGNWHLLTEIDELEFVKRGQSLSAHFDNAGTAVEGVPQEYNIVGTSIYLYPTPSYNSTNGLKVRFQRPPSYFATTDTTKEPGFTDTHHTYLSDYATMKYGLNRTLDSKNDYAGLIRIWEEVTIPGFYAKRNKNFTPRITTAEVEHE